MSGDQPPVVTMLQPMNSPLDPYNSMSPLKPEVLLPFSRYLPQTSNSGDLFGPSMSSTHKLHQIQISSSELRLPHLEPVGGAWPLQRLWEAGLSNSEPIAPIDSFSWLTQVSRLGYHVPHLLPNQMMHGQHYGFDGEERTRTGAYDCWLQQFSQGRLGFSLPGFCIRNEAEIQSTTFPRIPQRNETGGSEVKQEFGHKTTQRRQPMRRRRRSHVVEKLLECSYCGKRFRLKHQLDTHFRVHTGEKPFSCTLCNQRSRDYSAMIKHLRTHGVPSPYCCTLCSEFCSSRSSMHQHMDSHPATDIPANWTITDSCLYSSKQ